jgi:hypothetical protein
MYIKMMKITMKKELIILGISMLVIFVNLSGCTETNSDKFVGVWKGISISEDETYNITFTFNEDKTVKQECHETHVHMFYYEIKNDVLCLTFMELPEIPPICYSYKFSNNDTNLTLVNESFNTLLLTKQ